VSAAVVTDVITNPLWMIKTRLQTQGILGEHNYRGIVHAARTIVEKEGLFALWAGVTPQLLGTVHVAIQFPLYEKLKIYLQGDKEQLSTFDTIQAAAISKTIASVAAYPHEVLRAKFQFQQKHHTRHYSSLREAIVKLYAEEGMKGFYKGMGTNLLRVVPSCAITFSVYEFVMQKLLQ